MAGVVEDFLKNLALCSYDAFTDFNWKVVDDTHQQPISFCNRYNIESAIVEISQYRKLKKPVGICL